jgi:hypothetical protein
VWTRALGRLRQGRTRLTSVLLVCLLGCRATGCWGASLSAEVDGRSFTRCAQAAAPSAREVQVGSLSLTIDGRVLRIEGAHALRIAAFAGPVGGRLDQTDLQQVARARPGLVLYLGGLGDDEASARHNLASLATLHVPVLFIAGGADRLPIVEAAFAALGEGDRDRLLHASGLREVLIGADRLLIAPGAVLGRYTLDEQSCGLTQDDLSALEDSDRAGRTWLVSWQAPAGFGVSTGFAGSELGSPELQTVASALAVAGGLFAYPEAQVGQPRLPGLALVVPRLSRLGAQRADGSRLPSQVASLVLTAEGLVPSP